MGHNSPRDEHCFFAVLNNYGKCVANCVWNEQTLYAEDCTGIQANNNHNNQKDGQEVQLKGNRP